MLGTRFSDILLRQRERETERDQQERNYAFYAEWKVKIQPYCINCNLTFFYAFYAIYTFYPKRKVKIHISHINCNLTYFYAFYVFYAGGKLIVIKTPSLILPS